MDDSGDSTAGYCTSCGEPLSQDDSFCPMCGESVGAGASQRANGWGETAGTGPTGTQGTTTDRHPDSDLHPSTHRPASARHREGDADRWGSDPSAGRDYSLARIDETPLQAIARGVALGLFGMILLVIVSVIAGFIGFGLGLPMLVVLGLGTAIGQYIGFAGFGIEYLRRRGLDWDGVRSYLGVRWPSLRELGVIVAGYLALIVLLIIVAAIAQVLLPEPAENEGAAAIADADNTLVYVGAIAMMFLVVGPCEEILYRGVVQNRLRETLSPAPAILVASAIFAAVHVIALAGSLVAMLTTITILFVPAIVLGVVYEYTGNIVVPSLLHSIHNSILITILFFGPELEENAQLISTLAVVLLP